MGIKDLVLKKTNKIISKITKKEDPPAPKSLLIGSFHSNAKGFGFVTIEGEDEDYYISKNNTRHAFDGDLVIIERVYESAGKRKEAKITAVKTHAVTSLVGTVVKKHGYFFVIPDNVKYNQEIHIPKDRRNHAVEGQKVICHIVRYASERFDAEGEIMEILGHKDDPGVDILALVRDAGVPYEFPPEVISEAISVSSPVGKKELQHREDLRGIKTVTIDGDDTKDFDDAVSISKEGEDYILGVHIADVTHYVTEGSFLDKEAAKRTTSIYLADRVIPMLPHTLSNGICSLNEGEDRLTLSCIMRFNSKGKQTDSRVTASVIRVTHRMTYHDVNRILEDKDASLINKYSDMHEDFLLMEELSKKLRHRREKRGAVDFDFTESHILMDETGHPYAIEPYIRGTSQMMIEDFMVAANETVASIYFHKEVPFLYRIHGEPSEDKIIDLKRFISKFGYGLRQEDGSVAPKELQHLIANVKGTKEENLISTLVLRTMQRAEYATGEIGHYGLAAEYYSHFTSPIRRYPDLMIHRIIKEDLNGKLKRRRRNFYAINLPNVAKECTAGEKRADDLERDVEKLKKVEYMEDHIGEVFEGVISGVTNWGFYVSLPNTVEGLVPMATLDDDYYVFAEDTYELIGRHFNKRYRLGTPVRIRVAACDTKRRTVDFVTADKNLDKKVHSKKSSRRGKSLKKQGKDAADGSARKRKKGTADNFSGKKGKGAAGSPSGKQGKSAAGSPSGKHKSHGDNHFSKNKPSKKNNEAQKGRK